MVCGGCSSGGKLRELFSRNMVLGLLLAAQGLTSASHSLQLLMVQIAMQPRSWKLEAMELPKV